MLYNVVLRSVVLMCGLQEPLSVAKGKGQRSPFKTSGDGPIPEGTIRPPAKTCDDGRANAANNSASGQDIGLRPGYGRGGLMQSGLLLLQRSAVDSFFSIKCSMSMQKTCL